MQGPIRGICSMATRGLLMELAPDFARHAGVQVHFDAVGGVEAARRIAAGEPYDAVVLASDAIDKLAAIGWLDVASKVDLFRSSVGMAVRAGSEHPDVSTGAELRKSLLGAPTIGYSTGPSGTALMALFKRWGIADSLGERLVQAPPGVPVGSLVARGEVVLGFQQISELIGIEGIELLNPLAPEAQISTVFSGAVVNGSSQKVAVEKLLAFMASSRCATAKGRHGLRPA